MATTTPFLNAPEVSSLWKWRVTEILSRDNPVLLVVSAIRECNVKPVTFPVAGFFIRVCGVPLKLSIPLEWDPADDSVQVWQATLLPSFDDLRARAVLFRNYDDNRFGLAFAEVLERIRQIV